MFGTTKRPRVAFFKSNKYVYAQAIDDESGNTLIGVSSLKSKAKGAVASAEELAHNMSKAMKEKDIKTIVFDKGGFMYTGAVKMFADTLRTNGIKF